MSVQGRKLSHAGDVSSNPRHGQNLIYFDLSLLAKRPLLGRQFRFLTDSSPFKIVL